MLARGRQEWLYPADRLPAKVARAIDRLRHNEPKNSRYWGCFSGGKDSVVIKEIARQAGVDVEWHYNMTTIDPPELIYFIRDYHPDVTFQRPEHGNFFYRMIACGNFPSRRIRWCCREYKESANPKGRTMILGVRGAESPRRAITWSVITHHNRTGADAIAPIVDWSDADVWEFIHENKLPYCSLYDEGFKRLGCIGCPMARRRGRLREFSRWPKYERLWKMAFRRIWEKRRRERKFGPSVFKSWEEMWEWWLSDEGLPREDDECQGTLELWG